VENLSLVSPKPLAAYNFDRPKESLPIEVPGKQSISLLVLAKCDSLKKKTIISACFKKKISKLHSKFIPRSTEENFRIPLNGSSYP
jgi:hypothetical protein